MPLTSKGMPLASPPLYFFTLVLIKKRLITNTTALIAKKMIILIPGWDKEQKKNQIQNKLKIVFNIDKIPGNRIPKNVLTSSLL